MTEIIAIIAVILILSDPRAVMRLLRGVVALFRSPPIPIPTTERQDACACEEAGCACVDGACACEEAGCARDDGACAHEETLIALARLVRAGKVSAAVAVEVGLGVRRGGRAKRYVMLRDRIEALARADEAGGNDEIVGVDERGRVIRRRSDGSRYVIDAATRSIVALETGGQYEGS
jgi:hypothetical protein